MALQLNNFIGFETGGLEEAREVLNAPTIVTSPVRTGDYALALSGFSVLQYVMRPFEFGSDQGDDYIAGFAFRTNDTTPGVEEAFFSVSNGATVLTLSLETDGDLILKDVTNTIVGTATTPFTVNTWHLVEILWQNLDSGNADIYVDGVPKISVSGIDFRGASDFSAYEFRRSLNFAGLVFYFDDFYCYSGASSVSEFLGDPEVFRYQANTNSATPDSGSALDTGVWQNLGKTPVNADEAVYSDGAARSGFVYSDDSPSGNHYRHGPHGDASIDADIKGGKWLHQLKSSVASTTGRIRYGNDGDGAASRDLTLGTTFDNKITGSEAAAEVPTTSEHFALGFGKGASGVYDVTCREMWAFLLQGPSVLEDAFEAARQFGGLQPIFEPPEIVAY